jgi:hypothetical protein
MTKATNTATKEPQLPDFPAGYRGTTQMPDWVVELIEAKPESKDAWVKWTGLAHGVEPETSDIEILDALYESTADPKTRKIA